MTQLCVPNIAAVIDIGALRKARFTAFFQHAAKREENLVLGASSYLLSVPITGEPTSSANSLSS